MSILFNLVILVFKLITVRYQGNILKLYFFVLFLVFALFNFSFISVNKNVFDSFSFSYNNNHTCLKKVVFY